MTNVKNIEINLLDQELETLTKLRQRRHTSKKPYHETLSTGENVADKVAAIVGSWKFVIIQSIILALWIVLNVTAYIKKWDPYPFILLNLFLSFQAAYTAPIIMMSQNRQATIDRKSAKNDYDVNLKAELEIELLHQKIDLLREKDISELINIIHELEKSLSEIISSQHKPKENKDNIEVL